MPSWINHKATIYEYGSGSFIGSMVGTIDRILEGGAEGTNNLNEVGSGWFLIHGSDTPSRSLCEPFRVARVTAESTVSGKEHEVCCFIIRSIEPEIRGRHAILRVSGPDLFGNSKYANIGFNVISDNAGGPSSTPVQDCMLLTDKSWTVTEHGTAANGAVAVGAGETAFVVLINLIQQMGAHVSFALKGNPNFELHVWHAFTETAPFGFDALTLLESETPAAYQSNPNVAIIKEPIRIVREEQDVFTRAYVYGAGMGADRWTFKEFNLGPFLIPWGINSNNSLIINYELEAQIPVIATTKQFPELEPDDPNDPVSVETNARAIFYSGLTWLKHRQTPYIEYFEVPNLIIHADILPGQLVHITYNRMSPVDSDGNFNQTEILALDDDLIVLGIKHKIGKGGIRYTTLLLGATPKRPSNGLNMMAERLKDLENTVRHTNAGSGGGGEPTGESSYLWASGSGPILTGDLLVDPLVTIDGVDISAHAADFDAHHSPGTISVSSTNANNGTETHEVDSSYNPGAQAYLLQTGPNGELILVKAELDSLVLTDRTSGQKYNIFIDNSRVYIEPVS